jgi:hypothetical protein
VVIDDSAAMATREPAREAPPLTMWLMASVALIPFPLSAGLFVFGPRETAREALTVLLTWSAVVLAYLAGVRWGLESGRRTPRVSRLAGAVAFGVIAWGLLLARWRIELSWTLAAYLAAFMVQWTLDHATPAPQARFPRLSTAITAAACVSLALALDEVIRG